MDAATLPIRRRPALLDRFDQPGSAVADDQHRRRQSSRDQVAGERLPVLVGLAHPESGLLHSESTSRIDRPRTNAPITNAFNGSVRNSFGVRGSSFDANVSAASRT
jgi:hypothetical protein